MLAKWSTATRRLVEGDEKGPQASYFSVITLSHKKSSVTIEEPEFRRRTGCMSETSVKL
jgi:hypothetical protein